MSYNDLESSIEYGRPSRLYRFSLGDKVWRYTSGEVDETLGGFTWLAGAAISDDGVKQTGESTTDGLTITASSGIEPVQIYMHYPPSSAMQVAIFHHHPDDFDGEVVAVYMGEVTQVDVPVPGTATIPCETISASMRRAGLRLGWQRTCPYALYDAATCRLNKATYAVAAVATLAEDGQLQATALAAHPVGYFSGGFIEWTDPVRGVERRGIETHGAGGLITLFGSAMGTSVGMSFTAYPGCARTTTACNAFGNIANYGGIPDLQGRSPFDGNPVFL